MKSTVIRSGQYRVMPWKNGMGTTKELYIAPEGSTLEKEDFLWRLSSADVSAGGPFSSFSGYHRALFLLSGDGMDLTVDGEEVSLALPFSFTEFDGEIPVTCSLHGGPVTDFNIVVRKDALSFSYEFLDQVGGGISLLLAGDTTVLLCLEGAATISGAAQEDLGTMDLLILGDYPSGAPLRVGSRSESKVLRITFREK